MSGGFNLVAITRFGREKYLYLILLQSYTQQSKHLKSRLGPPVSNEKVSNEK